jgi:hypothetical protein
VERKEGAPKVFRGASKGSTQLKSTLGNEEAPLMAKKATIGSFQMGVGGVSVSEDMSKLTVEVFAFIIMPIVYEARSSFKGR